MVNFITIRGHGENLQGFSLQQAVLDSTGYFGLQQYLGNSGEICSSRMSKQENVITIELVTTTFCHVFMEIQAGTIFAKEFGLRNLAEKKFQ